MENMDKTRNVPEQNQNREQNQAALENLSRKEQKLVTEIIQAFADSEEEAPSARNPIDIRKLAETLYHDFKVICHSEGPESIDRKDFEFWLKKHIDDARVARRSADSSDRDGWTISREKLFTVLKEAGSNVQTNGHVSRLADVNSILKKLTNGEFTSLEQLDSEKAPDRERLKIVREHKKSVQEAEKSLRENNGQDRNKQEPDREAEKATRIETENDPVEEEKATVLDDEESVPETDETGHSGKETVLEGKETVLDTENEPDRKGDPDENKQKASTRKEGVKINSTQKPDSSFSSGDIVRGTYRGTQFYGFVYGTDKDGRINLKTTISDDASISRQDLTKAGEFHPDQQLFNRLEKWLFEKAELVLYGDGNAGLDPTGIDPTDAGADWSGKAFINDRGDIEGPIENYTRTGIFLELNSLPDRLLD